uniref:RIB43A domain with coiled-coils 2 n=1 Tax=Leptobrachium leishanense TaxID=445787 RepID=A0A8C5PLI2_9ANUR
MYKLDLPQDLKEAALLEKRRNAEQQRQDRIFNTKVRTIGVDRQALDVQTHDKEIQRETEGKRDEAYELQMTQHDKIASLLDTRQQEEIRNLNRAVDMFRLSYQKKEDRREYDLYDPQSLKKDLPARVSDEDPRCSVSGVQKLMGEDLNQEQRKKAQQEQLREWSLQQQYEWAKGLEDQKMADSLYDKMRIELDQKAMELQEMEESARKAVCTFTKTFNKAQAAEMSKRKELEKKLETEDNMAEISNLLQGDLLSENPDQASSVFGPHRVVPDRWKGMPPQQLQEIKNVQQQQILEQQRLKDEERQKAAEWDRHRVQAARAMLLLERQQKRQEQELRKAQDHINQQLAQAHQAQKTYMDKEVFTNAPTDKFFDQFNKSSR